MVRTASDTYLAAPNTGFKQAKPTAVVRGFKQGGLSSLPNQNQYSAYRDLPAPLAPQSCRLN